MRGAAGRMAALSPEEISRRLRREGIACAENGESGNAGPGHRSARVFAATVCDVEATEIRRIYPGGDRPPFARREAEPDERLRSIVARAAVRAVYALGLEAGQVEVSTDEAGKPMVVRIAARMKPSTDEGVRRTWEAMDLHASLRKAEKVRSGRVMLGADPEFVLQSPDGRVAAASRYLPPSGWAGCDSVVRRGVRVWPLVELRPDPAYEPAQVAASLRRLLKLAARRIDGAGAGAALRWLAGAWPVPGLPLGGHVHISGVALTGERLRALDNAVALPLRLLEPPGAARRRPRYGALGDFRRQPHGGFEYRTPPSWLVSPRLARGVLSLAKIAAEHAGELAGCRPLDDDALRDAFYGASDKGGSGEEALREAALAFHGELKKLDGYRRYASDADYVFEAVRTRRHWDESADFRRKWGIPTASALTDK